jgi:hypothetical protein
LLAGSDVYCCRSWLKRASGAEINEIARMPDWPDYAIQESGWADSRVLWDAVAESCFFM